MKSTLYSLLKKKTLTCLLITLTTYAYSQTKYIDLRNGSSSAGINDPALSGASCAQLDGYGGPVPNTPFDNWYAAVLTMGNPSRGLQIMHGYPQYDELYFRGGTDGWHSWRKILNESNISSFALPLTGGTVNGNVGIGTTNINDATYRLYVEKGIRTRKIRVDQDSWADIVFDTAYRLRPLSEVEQYIQHYRHLPEVPSAAEVAKDGLDLGDNQATLLKKIEELTLYIIEQDKKIIAQQNQLKDLLTIKKDLEIIKAKFKE
ncbi:MAG: hypothetical protein ACTHLE_23230 [Agriterribacter sp.]